MRPSCTSDSSIDVQDLLFRLQLRCMMNAADMSKQRNPIDPVGESWARRDCRFVVARPPDAETYGTMKSSDFFQVSVPTRPFEPKPIAVWKLFTAFSVP